MTRRLGRISLPNLNLIGPLVATAILLLPTLAVYPPTAAANPGTQDTSMAQSLQDLSRILGAPADSITVNPRPDQPHTTFQTPTGYIPEHDIRTDAVIVYSSLADRIATWKQKDYSVQTMYGFLEYSSLYNLMRGTGKRLWFLMDPLEDNPDRSMEDYQSNYVKTLAGSLMFPDVDEFEVMPWPDRIFGRVPGPFATEIMSVVTMLGDIHNQKEFDLDAGTEGIATFVADSMGWQRAEPGRSNYDCFYGLTLPLIMRGIPVQVAQLERTPQPKYLDPYKVILLSYDIMKPLDKRYNEALAKWVKAGGTLILFGGQDVYNDLPGWWKKEGFARPQDDLLQRLGIDQKRSVSMTGSDDFRLVGMETKPVRSGENRQEYTFDVSKYLQPCNGLFVKIEDARKSDGWGPLVRHAEFRVNGKTIESFEVGSPEEKAHIVADEGSVLQGNTRFADGDNYWIYEFKVVAKKSESSDSAGAQAAASRCCENALSCAPGDKPKIEIVLDMANQYRVSSSVKCPVLERTFRGVGKNALTVKWPEFTVSAANSVTAYDTDGLYLAEGTEMSPIFERNVGKGSVIFCGIAPSYFASSPEAADLLRGIVAYGCEKAKLPYREQHYMMVRRGRYVAARSFDRPVTIRGKFLNVLDPELSFVTNPKVGAGDLAVYADVKEMLADSRPRLMLSSSRLEAKSESSDLTSVLLSGPLGTRGVVRFSTAGRQPKSVEVLDTAGKPVAFEQKIQQDTLLITHDGQPDGVVVRVAWE